MRNRDVVIYHQAQNHRECTHLNPSNQKAKAGRSQSPRSAWATSEFQDTQSYTETLQIKHTNKQKLTSPLKAEKKVITITGNLHKAVNTRKNKRYFSLFQKYLSRPVKRFSRQRCLLSNPITRMVREPVSVTCLLTEYLPLSPDPNTNAKLKCKTEQSIYIYKTKIVSGTPNRGEYPKK